MGLLRWTLIQYDWCTYQMRKMDTRRDTLGTCKQRTQHEDSHLQPKERHLRRTWCAYEGVSGRDEHLIQLTE